MKQIIKFVTIVQQEPTFLFEEKKIPKWSILPRRVGRPVNLALLFCTSLVGNLAPLCPTRVSSGVGFRQSFISRTADSRVYLRQPFDSPAFFAKSLPYSFESRRNRARRSNMIHPRFMAAVTLLKNLSARSYCTSKSAAARLGCAIHKYTVLHPLFFDEKEKSSIFFHFMNYRQNNYSPIIAIIDDTNIAIVINILWLRQMKKTAWKKKNYFAETKVFLDCVACVGHRRDTGP